MKPEGVKMETSKIILFRCRAMNCINQGQAVSIGSFESDFGGRNEATAALGEMVLANLLSKGTSGTYLLTQAGADAISTSVLSQENFVQSRSKQFRRPPVNKLQ